MFADDERDELEVPADPEPEDSAPSDEPEEEVISLSTMPDDDTGEFLESAPSLSEAAAPVDAEQPDEEAVEDWVTVEMPRSKSSGPADAGDPTPPEEITPVEELRKVPAPAQGAVVEPASAPVAAQEEPAAETVGAPAPLIEREVEPPPPLAAAAAPAEVVPPAAPPVIPPKPVEAAPLPASPPAAAAPEPVFLGPVGRGLSGIGIRDRRAQQWVSAGVAAVLLACCTCSCMVAIALTSFRTVGG